MRYSVVAVLNSSPFPTRRSSDLLFVDYTGIKIVPSVAKDWKLEDGGKTTTLFLRKGMKWSDGELFTADDIVFWFEHLYSNKELRSEEHTSELQSLRHLVFRLLLA